MIILHADVWREVWWGCCVKEVWTGDTGRQKLVWWCSGVNGCVCSERVDRETEGGGSDGKGHARGSHHWCVCSLRLLFLSPKGPPPNSEHSLRHNMTLCCYEFTVERLSGVNSRWEINEPQLKGRRKKENNFIFGWGEVEEKTKLMGIFFFLALDSWQQMTQPEHPHKPVSRCNTHSGFVFVFRNMAAHTDINNAGNIYIDTVKGYIYCYQLLFPETPLTVVRVMTLITGQWLSRVRIICECKLQRNKHDFALKIKFTFKTTPKCSQ